MAKEIRVQIVGDADSFRKALGQASAGAQGFSGHLGKVAKVAGLALGGGGAS